VEVKVTVLAVLWKVSHWPMVSLDPKAMSVAFIAV
jgi:hypothetical protein